MLSSQLKLSLSYYSDLYDMIVPKDHILRKIRELVDFSFIYDELKNKYCLDNGRNAKNPILLFKYLLLKYLYNLSDNGVVERSRYDMSFKYFLDMAPEDEVINPSSLTKFRKLRLKDMNLLDMLIAKTVQLALEKGIIKSKSIIVDATHTKSRYNQKTPRQVLQEQSKKLRRSIYEIDETMKEKFPDKKIIGYIWPQYYNLKNNPDYMKFIPAEKWDKILEGCYTYLDGAVIWSNGKGEDGETDVAWNDTKVQAMYSATKTFIERHKANIKLDKPIGGGDDGGSEPTEFYVYGSLNFQNTPSNLLSYGIQPISVISEANVSETEKQGSVYPPVIDKIKNLATDATHPVCISISTWHADRSTDNSAMMSRFQTVYSTFKDNNSKVTIGYRGVGPTSLTSLRVTNYTQSDFQRNDSWQRYAVEPMRGIREYADVLYPEVTIINDDLDTWKQDCSAVLEEAKWNNPNKKIFACIMTNYFNKTGTIPEDYEAFADAYKPIKEATWLNALEYLYRRCDGIVIIGNCQKNDPIEYSEDLGLMKATKTFYENHKNIIDKTLPEEEKPTTDNLITNGGFEDSIEPSSTLPVVHTNSLVRPLRLSGFFDTTAQKTFPTVDGTVTVPDNVWFHRCNNNSWFWFTYIDDMSIAYTGGGTPISHSGNKSVVIYTAANADAAKYSSHANNLEHIQVVVDKRTHISHMAAVERNLVCQSRKILHSLGSHLVALFKELVTKFGQSGIIVEVVDLQPPVAHTDSNPRSEETADVNEHVEYLETGVAQA